jgi:hypothetical protein
MKPKNPWLVGPAFDVLVYSGIIFYSAALVLLLKRWVEPFRLFLYFNVGFTLVHFGPTWARAYLDKTVFRQHRLRIIVFPVLFFAFAFLVRGQPVALAFVVFFWDRFHALMQNYGFLRLYEAKARPAPPISPGLELGLLFASAAAILSFNVGLLTQPVVLLYQVGWALPVSAKGILAFRAAALACVAVLGALYVRACVSAARTRGWTALLPKLIYWAGLLGGHALMNVTSNVFLLSAHEKIYHSVQYVALSWFYNHHRSARASRGELTRPFRALFSTSRPWAYLGALALWGGFAAVLEQTYFRPDAPHVVGTAVFSTLFVGIALTHYYFDSFLWRVRDPAVQGNL